MRLIDADELKEQCHTIPDPKGIYCGLDIIEKYEIDDAPTVDVLEQIRAEIEQERDKVYQNRQGCDTYYADGLDTALDIIDKYKGVKE